MSGYDGYSKSNNAVYAEEAGRYPITKASRIVANETGLTVKEARRILEEHGNHGEYHHSSKFYNCVNYYDTVEVIAVVNIMKETNMDWGNAYEEMERREDLILVIAAAEGLLKAQKNRDFCAAHGHDMKPIMFPRKQRDGGGEYIHHYRCGKCGFVVYQESKENKKAGMID